MLILHPEDLGVTANGRNYLKLIVPSDGGMIGITTFDGSEPPLQGHFPGRPVVPATALTELVGQYGLVRLAIADPGSGVSGCFFQISSFSTKVRSFVEPGKLVTIEGNVDGLQVGANLVVERQLAVQSKVSLSLLLAEPELEARTKRGRWQTLLSGEMIPGILPHRDKMLLSGLVANNARGQARALFYPRAGYYGYSNRTIVPNTILAEAMGQGSLAMLLNERWPGRKAETYAIEITFESYCPVVFGEEVVTSFTIGRVSTRTEGKSYMIRGSADAFVGGRKVAKLTSLVSVILPD